MQKDAKSSQQDTSSDESVEHVDRYNCSCRECRRKFGGLPLLVDVIERDMRQTRSDQPQPSTSQSEPARSTGTNLMHCAHCDKTFTHRGDLNKHLRRHTGEQPYKCPVCSKRFAHNSNLTRHSRLHSGDKPFTCDRCQKRFARKDKLELHRRSKSCRD